MVVAFQPDVDQERGVVPYFQEPDILQPYHTAYIWIWMAFWPGVTSDAFQVC